MIEAYNPGVVWIVIVGFIIAFVLAFGIGANDVANSFGTSVGSKVLTITQACCLATVFEIAGAVLIGYKVSDTMRKGILDVTLYEEKEIQLMYGCLSALLSSTVWLIFATFFKLPISGTHSIVGATVGFSLVAQGPKGINWKTLITIVISWFASPVLSGIVSVIIYGLIKKTILTSSHPMENGLNSLPFFYGFTLLVNTFSIVHDGPKLLNFDQISIWGVFFISLTIGLVTSMVVKIFLVPWHKRKIAKALVVSDKFNTQPSTPVNFLVGTSNESSPEPSPKNQHHLNKAQSSTNQDNVQLSVISEHSEMLPLTEYQNKNFNSYSNPDYVRSPEDISSFSTISTIESKKNGNVMDPKSVQNKSPIKSNFLIVDSNPMINPNLTPNSSGVPLILDKSNLAGVDSTTNILGDRNKFEDDDSKINLEDEKVCKLFSFLQVLTATFGSFAHGGNDVSNAIGPLIALWLIYTEGSVMQKSETPLYILLFGGVGISVGLWFWGRRVIQTIGEDLTQITPSTGFTIEIGSAFTVLLASKIGVPVSTTHCKVGSVVFVGYTFSSSRGVDWKLFRNIISAWIVTVPIAAVLSAVCMYALLMLDKFILNHN